MEKISLQFVPSAEVSRIRKQVSDRFTRAQILGDLARLHALSMIMYAGSGHPGTTFSAMDIVTWLWTEELRNPNETDANPSDLYFSSKGHDVPGLYAILIGLGKLPADMNLKLRRLGGLPGHPDRGTPFLLTNTGSLGMGISKAKGMALANRLKGTEGRVHVLTGDGELQEGQIWESLISAANGKFSEITAIVDHNKIQSDIHVKDTSDLGDLEQKFRAFGWAVRRIDGHDARQIADALAWAKRVTDRPQVIIADTVKGRGVSFMERLGDDGLYKFHSGALSAEQYAGAVQELTGRISRMLTHAGLAAIQYETVPLEPRGPWPEAALRLNAAHGDELTKIAAERKDVIALDADLVLDTGLIPFKKAFPERYLECGIAEQDMVSMAGGLALRGMVPVVHSFSCFLSTRPNEQIYNNATEKTKIVYVASLAGLLPATPGHSHQSVRDISTVGSMPHLAMIEPSSEREARMAIRWAIAENPESTFIRLCNIPAAISYEVPADYRLEVGRGVFLKQGNDLAIVGYGPVMLEQAMQATKLLVEAGIHASVLNLPWLNRMNEAWLREALGKFRLVATLDNHYVSLGQGVQVARVFAGHPGGPRVISFGLTEVPACGQNKEVLEYHGLDAATLAKRIQAELS